MIQGRSDFLLEKLSVLDSKKESISPLILEIIYRA